jgi:hypothetical protein
MLQQEKQRSDARHLKRDLAKVEDNTYVEKTNQAEVEHHMMEICSAHFRLTATPGTHAQRTRTLCSGHQGGKGNTTGHLCDPGRYG